MQWLFDLLTSLAAWLKDFLLYVPKWIWQHLLEALSSMIAAIPVPDAFASFAANIGGIPSTVLWFLDIMEFKYGVTVILAAMGARFLMKFIPTLSF